MKLVITFNVITTSPVCYWSWNLSWYLLPFDWRLFNIIMAKFDIKMSHFVPKILMTFPANYTVTHFMKFHDGNGKIWLNKSDSSNVSAINLYKVMQMQNFSWILNKLKIQVNSLTNIHNWMKNSSELDIFLITISSYIFNPIKFSYEHEIIVPGVSNFASIHPNFEFEIRS